MTSFVFAGYTLSLPVPHSLRQASRFRTLPKTLPFSRTVSFLGLLDTVRVQRMVSFLALLCRIPVPILKHRLELEGISHVVSLVSFSDVKAF